MPEAERARAPLTPTPAPGPGAAADGPVRRLLTGGEMEVLGRMPWSSNQTFLVKVVDADGESLGIYKPRKGERPLWDFPHGTLCQREVAAFEVSDALGWDLVPLSVLRDGPFGEGMLQRFVDHDPEEHFFTLREEHGDRFRQFALFDVVINNADRKSGHCLRAAGDGHIWGIDHGVSFHNEVKLRTVIWDYEGEPIAPALLADLARLDRALEGVLAPLLSVPEITAAARRLRWLLEHGVFPPPQTDYPYPWPMV